MSVSVKYSLNFWLSHVKVLMGKKSLSCGLKYRFPPHTVIEGQCTVDIIMTDIFGIHLGQLWRLQISRESMACVIAQRRVQPIMVNGNPLTEHNQLFVRAYVCADQQVLCLTKLDGSHGYKHADLKGHSHGTDSYFQDALTYMTCSRRSAVTGKVRILTLFSWMFFCWNGGRQPVHVCCASNFGDVCRLVVRLFPHQRAFE